jgi:hypothetical protein
MKNKKEHKKAKPVVVVAIVIVALGVIFGVLYFTGVFNRHGRFYGNYQGRNMMNIQLNESQISEVNSFFNGNPSLEETQAYCKANRGLCFYYCRNTPNSELCPEIMNFTRPNNQTWQSQGAPVQ